MIGVDQKIDQAVADAKRECATKTDQQFARAKDEQKRETDSLRLQTDCVITELKGLKSDADEEKDKKAHTKRGVILSACAVATVLTAGLASPALIVEVCFESEIRKIKENYPGLRYHERVTLFENGLLITNGQTYKWPIEKEKNASIFPKDSDYNWKNVKKESYDSGCSWGVSDLGLGL